MKILFIGVFDTENKSTNNSQAKAFEILGHKVLRYNYREKAQYISNEFRDTDIIQLCRAYKPDLTLFSKCNGVNIRVFEECKKVSTTCLWFMDPLVTYDNAEIKEKTKEASFVCCSVQNVTEYASQFNSQSFCVFEGFDSFIEKPQKQVAQITDVSFIGSLHTDRAEKLKLIETKIQLINNAYGLQHRIAVSQSKINLNFCTTDGASDRIFKVMGAKGFLLTDDWTGRDTMFKDGEDLVIYKSYKDLDTKIKYYLEHPEERDKIRSNGYKTVQKYNRIEWAKRILESFTQHQENQQ